jgi:hypothetical protein
MAGMAWLGDAWSLVFDLWFWVLGSGKEATWSLMGSAHHFFLNFEQTTCLGHEQSGRPASTSAASVGLTVITTATVMVTVTLRLEGYGVSRIFFSLFLILSTWTSAATSEGFYVCGTATAYWTAMAHRSISHHWLCFLGVFFFFFFLSLLLFAVFERT